jgi:hypothetical protein
MINGSLEHKIMLLTWKYVCKAVLNENGLLSVFVIVSSVERFFVVRMTCKEFSK